MEEIQGILRRVEQRDERLRRAAILLTGLLALTIVFLSVPGFWENEDPIFHRSRLRQTTIALLGVVLGGSVYVLYQQFRNKRLWDRLAEPMAAGIRVRSDTELQSSVILDPLTGLYNRPFLDQHLGTELARSQRQGHPLTALLVDLSNFKQINADYGRSVGDMVLKQFTDCLKRSVRSSDLPVRMGSDEFLVLLPESNPERIPHILTRLSGLEADCGGQKLPVTFAAGWIAHQPSEPADQFLQRLVAEVSADKQSGQSQEAIRQAQAEIRQMQNIEALGRLASKVAHDYNNLLNLVKGYSELALDSLGESDPLREYIEQIHDANERANSLTRQLLAFTRKQVPITGLLDLNALLVGIEPTLRRLLGDQIEVVTKRGERLGRIKGDRGQIEQILLNFAVYGRETMPEGGKWVIETANVELDEDYAHWHPGARPGAYVMLVARDTGAGIDEETLAHIFDPLYVHKKAGKGAGLSLAAIYGIVKQSGGYIWVESERGQGTTFTVFLPRVGEPVAAVREMK